MWHYFLEVKLAVQMSCGFICFLQYLSSCLSPLTLNPYSFQTHVLPLGFAKVYFLFPLQLTQRILRFASGKWCLVYKMDRQQSSEITSLEKRKWNEHSKTGADRVLGPPHPGRQLLVIDRARVPAMSLPFAAISRNLKLKMTGCCLCLCKALHVGS